MDWTVRNSLSMLRGKPLGRRLDFFARNYTLTGGALVLALVTLAAVVAPFITAYNPLGLDAYNRLTPPSGGHWFGTDHLGRDVYTRTIYGARISLLVGSVTAVSTAMAGILFGLIAGYYRVADAVIMRIMDALMSLPTLLLAIALMAMLGSSLQNVIIAATIVQIPRMTRVVRASVLALREAIFVEAARVIGARTPRILLYHILPNTIAPMMVQATYVFATAVLIEAALSFLGAGSPPFIPSWGNIMAEGRSYFQSAIWITLFPGLFLTLAVLAINIIGDSLRDILDPKLRGRM
jgi:peptide/nickel transport system permease protein